MLKILHVKNNAFCYIFLLCYKEQIHDFYEETTGKCNISQYIALNKSIVNIENFQN